MATEEIAIKITTDSSQTEKSVGSIRRELREATQDAVSLARKFGELSPEALAAAQKVANLKDEFGDLKQRIDALNPDAKFKAFSSALQGVAGGFAGVQGAIGLFGTESAELEKQLLKVQSALALSEGLNSVLAAKDSFANLGAIIKTRVVTAFSTLRGAIIATGLGALVVALGTIVAYWDEISEAITGATKETKAYDDAQKEVNKDLEKAYENLFAVSNAFKASKDGAISKSEALEIYNEKLGGTIGKAETLEQAERLYKANSANYIKSITARATAQVLLAKASQAAAKAATGEDADLSWWDKAVVAVQGAVGGIGMAQAEIVKRQSINRQENQNEIKLYQDLALKELENASEAEGEIKKNAVANGTNIVKKGVKEQTAIKKQGLTQEEKDADERRKKEEKEAQDKKELYEKNQKELQEINAKAAEENRLSRMTEFERDIEELTTEYNDKLAKAREFNTNIDAVTEEYNRKVAERQKEQDVLDMEAQIKKDDELIAKTEGDFANDLAILEAQREMILSNTAITGEERNRLLQENADKAKAIGDAEVESKRANMEAIKGLLGELAGIAGESTAVGKALALANIGIDTAQAISALTKASEQNPANGVTFGAAGAIQFAAGVIRIAANIKKAKDLLSKVKGGAGNVPSVPAGGSASATAPTQAPIASTFSPTQSTMLQNSSATASNQMQPIKAFVVESDMTDSQDRIAKIKSAATL